MLGTLTGRSCELLEALKRKRVISVRCRRRGGLPQVKGRGFRAVLCESLTTTDDVGIIVSERFHDSIVSVERFDDGLMKIVVAAKERLYHFFSAHAPHAGCSDQAKDDFWSLLDEKAAGVPSNDVIVVAGGFNGQVGATKDGLSCHGGFGYRSPNAVDRDRCFVTDAKAVPYETVAPQHQPLICAFKITPSRLQQFERCGAARIK
ncbi:unnamed protein product [Heligmosomoides polygyrus]|uniref:Craniofacial development protein 2-like n=1 Tax=Heligmosomoides polygyrus TaxID=6339 RepID=A0A183GQR7_HELPZ|nr:unnamed protein product [Heligmosomoides polygyrus]